VYVMPCTGDRPTARKLTKCPSAVEVAHILYGALSDPMAPDETNTHGCGGTVFFKSPWLSLMRKDFAMRVAAESGPREALGEPVVPTEQPETRPAAMSPVSAADSHRTEDGTFDEPNLSSHRLRSNSRTP